MNSPSFQNLRNSDCLVVISDCFWEQPQAISTITFTFLILFLMPVSACSCSVTHSMNGHTHGLQPFLTFRHESSTQELPEIHTLTHPVLAQPLSHHACTQEHHPTHSHSSLPGPCVCPHLTCEHMHTARPHHSCHAHMLTHLHAHLHAPMPPGTPPPPHALSHSHWHTCPPALTHAQMPTHGHFRTSSLLHAHPPPCPSSCCPPTLPQ